MRVVILHEDVAADAPPDAADLLVQVRAVEEALRQHGMDVRRLVFSPDLARTRDGLLALQPDCVFNLVETVLGEERLQLLAPALLESLRIPFTGGPHRAFLGTCSKPLSKRCLRDAGLPTPAWWDPTDPATWRADLGSRAIVKSVWDHGSVGLDASSVIDFPFQGEELLPQMARRSQFAEAYVEGREFNVSVLGDGHRPRVLPPAEIVFMDWPASRPRIVDYGAKWDPHSFAYARTQRRFDFPASDRTLLDDLGQLARAAWDLFGLRGYCRVDFRVDTRGQAWILEVNVNPCLAPDAGFAAALERAGIPYAQGILRILHDAVGAPGDSKNAWKSRAREDSRPHRTQPTAGG